MGGGSRNFDASQDIEDIDAVEDLIVLEYFKINK